MDNFTSAEVRLAVLEASMAAVIAQLPRASLEEVVGMLTYLAGMSEEAADVAGRQGQEQLEQVSKWVDSMLERVMVSRKLSRPCPPSTCCWPPACSGVPGLGQ